MIEFFEHTADVGFRVHATDRAELFQEAARAMFSIIVENLDHVQPLQHCHVAVSGTDEYLLFDWLTELLYIHETQHLVFSRFDVKFTPGGLVAEVAGEKMDSARHRLLHEVKAVTYHLFQVVSTSDGWNATIVLDI